MHPTAARLQRRLAERGLSVEVRELPDSTRTAAEAAAACTCEVGQIVKSLVFVCDGAYVLALVPGDRRADEGAIAAELGANEIRIARPDEVEHATGFEPGGVAPFPQRAVTQTLMDKDLLQHAVVWVGAGTPAHMAALPPGELQRLARARPVDLGPSG